MSDSVPVSPALLAIGGMVLVASLSMSAFLLGRATAPAAPVVVETRGAPVQATVAPTEAAPPQEPAPVAAQPGPATPASVPPKTQPPQTADVRAEVRAYLAQLDQEQGSIADGLDPQALVQQALTGDTSGIDALIANHTARMQRLARLPVPVPAKGHHTAMMALGRDGLNVMTQLRDGIASNDLNSLMSLQGDAGRLQRDGDRLTALEDQLRDDFGG